MTLAHAEAVYKTVARDAGLSATECAVLAMLALMAGEDGACWPKQQTIADRTRLHLDTVKATLRALHAKRLIDRNPRLRDDGSQASSMIVLRFPAADLKSLKSGDTPPRGGRTTPTPPGVHDPSPPGVDDPPHESSSEKKPPKSPKGDAGPIAKKLAADVWAEAPKQSRQRSGLGDLERACQAALERGADPDDVIRSLRACWSDLAGRDAMEHAKGVHRLLQQDRWREWMPDEDADGEGTAPPPKPTYTDAQMAAHLDRVWRSRLDDLKASKWDRFNWGPPPGQFACRVPANLLVEFGHAPTPEFP